MPIETSVAVKTLAVATIFVLGIFADQKILNGNPTTAEVKEIIKPSLIIDEQTKFLCPPLEHQLAFMGKVVFCPVCQSRDINAFNNPVNTMNENNIFCKQCKFHFSLSTFINAVNRSDAKIVPKKLKFNQQIDKNFRPIL